MAAILSSNGSATSGASALPAPAASVAPATGLPVAPNAGADEATDVFTQLISDMIANGTPADQTGSTSLLNLAAIELGADGNELSGDDRDVDSSEAAEGELDALMAALLPGLPAPPPAASTPAGATDTQTDAIEGASPGKRAEAEISQTVLSGLSGEPSDDTAASTTSTDSAKATPTQSATPSTQMHALMAAQAAARDMDTPDAALTSTVGTPAWKEELGTHLTWMAAKGLESASLRLSPEHLGPLDIRISVREGEASVYFAAASPDTRSALEQSLPRLRELFASQGLVLTDAGVSRDGPRNAFKPSAQSPGSRGVSDAAPETSVKSITLTRAGLIDTYV